MKEDPLFLPYRPRRAFQEIAEEIKRAIFEKRFGQGDRLPPERSLAEQFRVGRLTIREALRTLETAGFVKIKKGSGGGAFVGPDDPQSMAGLIIDNLMLEGLTSEQITEARAAIECAVVRSAIKHGSAKDLRRLAEDVEESKKIMGPDHAEEAFSRMVRFHILLAEASHNLAFVMFVRAVMEWGRRKRSHWAPSEDEQLYSYQAHKEILESIQKKDVETAQRLMQEHVEVMRRLGQAAR